MPDSVDRERLTSALVQAADGYLAWVRELLAAGADPRGMPLIMAIQCDEPEIVAAMVEAGADPNRPYRDTTPLVHAIRGRHPDVVRVLIEAGADVTQAAPTGDTPWSALQASGRTVPAPHEDAAIRSMLAAAQARRP